MKRLPFAGPGGPVGRSIPGMLILLGTLAGPAVAVGEGSRAGIPSARPDPPAVLVRMVPGTRPAPAPRATASGWSAIQAAQAPFGDLGLAAGEPLARTFRLVLRPGVDPVAAAAALAREPGVERAWVEGRFRVAWADAERFLGAARLDAAPAPAPPRAGAGPASGPNDPLYVDGSQWGLRNDGSGPFGGVAGTDLRAEAGWAVTSGSTAVPIAIIDTGIDLGHPDLGGTLAGGVPRILRAFNSSIEGDTGSPADSVGHGTMVAGVALARTNNGALLDGRGVAGMAGGAGGDSAGCRIIAVKATPTRLLDALGTELAKGIYEAVRYGARAINLSFGSDDDDDTVLDAISYAARNGCVVVCGAGNAPDDRPQYPGYYARYGAGISVAALRPDGALAGFSSRGAQIDVAAPGEQIYSTYLTYANAFDNPTRNYEYSSGTSFAAPFVTGLAGLVTTLQPSLTDNEFQALLRHTARDVGAPGRDDTFGWGVPDAGALLAYASPRGFLRGTTTAESWTLAGSDSVTIRGTRLAVGGCTVDGRYLAERWEVRAHVDLTGRLLETPLGIVRTQASRGWGPGPQLEYNLGWGEVVPGSAGLDGFTLRTYVYRIAAVPIACGGSEGGGTGATPIGYLPVPPEEVVFAWSAFGRIAVPLVITTPAIDGAGWPVDAADTLRWQADRIELLRGFEVDVSWDSGHTWHRRTRSTLPPETRSFALAAPCAVTGERTYVRVSALPLDGAAAPIVVSRGLVPARACAPGEEATVRITTPDADGAAWSVDAADTLRWEARESALLGGFTVDLSWDSGRSWRRQTTPALPAEARVYAFTAPCAVAGESTLVRLSALGLAGGQDEGVVTRRIVPARGCTPGEQPTLRVTTPALDAAPWPVDAADTLRWEVRDPAAVDGFQIDVSWDTGRTWRRLTTSALPREARAYAFAAPCAVAGEQSFVRVIALETRDGAPAQSEARRAIAPARACAAGERPTLRITTPAEDGAPWPVDVAETMRWEVAVPSEVNWFLVETSRDSGRTWQRLTEPALPRHARAYPFKAPCAVAGEPAYVRLIVLETRGGVSTQGEVRRLITPSRGCDTAELPPLRITTPGADGAPWPVDVADTLRWEVGPSGEAPTGFVLEVSWDTGRKWRRLSSAALPAAARAYALAAPCAVAGERTYVRLAGLGPQGLVRPETVTRRELRPSRLCLAGESPADSVEFAFLPVVPNPARGSILFRYAREPVDELAIHDARGRRVRTFTPPPAGFLVWDGRDDAGRSLPSGLYFARLRAGGREATQRFVYLTSP